MRFLFFSALLAAATPRLLAQNSTLIPGHLVTVSGDTLRGFVKDEDWVAGQAVEFSSSADGSRKAYDLASIRSLYMEQYNEYHIAATVDIDKKPIRLDNLERTGARNIVRETVLLKLLAGGQLNLYSYKDENRKNHYFIQPEGKDIKELPYVRYYAPGGDVVNMPFYLNVLKDLTKSCNKVAIRGQAYEESPLTKIVTTFNGCSGEGKREYAKEQHDGSYVKPHNRMKLSIDVFAGARYSGLKYDGYDLALPAVYLSRPSGAETVDFGKVFNMTGGVNFEMQPRKAANKLRLGWGFQWQQAGAFSGITTAQSTSQRQYYTKFNYVTGAANFRYRIVQSATWSAYAKASLGALYLINYDQRAAVVNGTAITEKDFMNYRKVGLDFAFRAGITYKRAFVELGYQRDSMYGDDASASATVGAVVALLGYRVF